MADVSTFTDAVSTFNSFRDAFNNYVVIPANQFGLGGFVFDVEGDSNITLTNEITDHYTEDNRSVQDHVAVRPKKITIKSYVGEVVYRPDFEPEDLLQTVVQKLTVLNQYLPKLSDAATQVKSFLDDDATIGFEKAVIDARNIYAIVKNFNPPIPRQQQAYQYFKALAEQKLIISVQTPFEYATDMIVETVSATQSEGSEWISDFSITLKEIRIVSSKTILSVINDYASKTASQVADPVDSGKTQGLTVSDPALTFNGWYDAFVYTHPSFF